MKFTWKRLLYLTAVVFALSWCASFAQTTFPALKLQINGHSIEAEVAATDDARDLGLMHRTSLPPDRGMLFVFPDARRHCMWMKDTKIALSVAFIGDTGKIVNITDMQPRSLDFHCATAPVLYALEMNKGWFLKKRIGPGAGIGGLEKAPRGR
jgi:uncharacterized membrane protein (UPF0127 family)